MLADVLFYLLKFSMNGESRISIAFLCVFNGEETIEVEKIDYNASWSVPTRLP